jgi:FlaA1/EpsC-like NDP-sugar epimerase
VFGIELILLAKPDATSAEMQHLVDLCEATRLPFRTVPSTKDFVAGRVVREQLRPVSIEDLLGRDPVAPPIVRYLLDTTDFVTVAAVYAQHRHRRLSSAQRLTNTYPCWRIR